MNKNKGIIGIGLIIAIVLGIVIVGGGAYYLGKSGSKQEVKNPENILLNNQNQNLPVVDNKQTSTPSITVLSPNGGEKLVIGSKYVIKYQASSAPKDAVVFLFIGLSGQDKWLKINSENSDSFSATSSSYTWTIPKEICGVEVCTSLISGKNYKLKVILTGTINNQFQDITSDTSDNSFTINSGTTQSSEESSTEVFNHQAGAIKSIKSDGTNKWIFAVDLLTYNPGWIPGVDNRYSNQSTKIRNLNVTINTKVYGCIPGPNGGGPDSSTIPNVNISDYISRTQNNINQIKNYQTLGVDYWLTSNFDINGTNITAIYEQCLP